jgi:hypothetical protein
MLYSISFCQTNAKEHRAKQAAKLLREVVMKRKLSDNLL